MANTRLKFALLSPTTIYDTDSSGNFIKVNGSITNGSNIITNITSLSGFKDLSYAYIGNLVNVAAGGFPPSTFNSSISSIDYINNSIVLTSNATVPTNTYDFFINPHKGFYFIESSSVEIPSFNNPLQWTTDDVIGSGDDNYDPSLNKWGVIGKLKFVNENNAVNGIYGQYEIYKIFYRGTVGGGFGTPAVSQMSFSIISNDGPLFEDDDKELANDAALKLSLVELSPTESLATIWGGWEFIDTNETVNYGEVAEYNNLGLAAYQTSLKAYDLKLDGLSAFPYTGSAQITGSLGVTGSVEFNTQVGGTDFFILRSGSIENFKINGEGIAQFYAYPNDYTPTPILGGLFFQTSSAWVGLE